MKMLTIRLAIAIGLVALVVPPARADDPASEATPAAEPTNPARVEASARFQRGVELFEEETYDAALVEFQRAYELVPNYQVLYNIAQTESAMRRFTASLATFERYLRLGGERITPERRAHVERWLETLRSRIGYLRVRTNVDGAEVFIDGEVIGRTPMSAPVPIDVGRHRLEVRASSRTPSSQMIDVAGGDEVDLNIELSVITSAPVDASQGGGEDANDAPRTRRDRLRIAGRGGLIGAGALGVSALLTGVFAWRAEQDLATERETLPGDPAALENAQNRMRRLSLSTDAIGGIAVGLSVTSLVLLVVGGRSDDEEASTTASVRVGVTPGGVVLNGRF